MKTSFSGHEKFECRTSWIPKALHSLVKNENLFQASHKEEAISQLGLGSNMIKSLRHWLLAFDLFNDQQLTEFGKLIYENDPYFEIPDTLWILHSIIAQKMYSATLYYLVFNQFFQNEFSKKSLLGRVKKWTNEENVSVSENTLISDIDVFIRMYCNIVDKGSFSDSIFAELNLLHEVNEHFELNFKTPQPLSNDAFLVIFLYTIQDISEKTLSIKDLQYGKVSLQNILLMTDEKFITRLEQLDEMTDGKIVYREASGLKQLYLNEQLHWLDFFPKVYKEHN